MKQSSNQNRKATFRIGKVRGDLRGKIWYLTYHENGKRLRPKIGPDKEQARQMAARINSQLESHTHSVFNFEPVQIDDLQTRWLNHHEQVLRSSLQTIRRYRAATTHLINFIAHKGVASKTSLFQVGHAEEFVHYLRTIKVAPNGHENSQKRHLLDKGIKYILQCCRSMFGYAIKRRHLSPYAENPFSSLDLDRIPIENAKVISIFSPDQEKKFLETCDDWQFPIFLTLMLTGLRPGELTHLLLPEDLDLNVGMLYVRNKPHLGWQVKTRNEREIPLIDELRDVLTISVGDRVTGPVFLQRRYSSGSVRPEINDHSEKQLEDLLQQRLAQEETASGKAINRNQWLNISRTIWRDSGALKTDRIRTEFIRLTKQIDLPQFTAPKSLRHLFATCLQDGNVDPLIRSELMGHSTSATNGASHGLGMTATYTHSRPETKRKQLANALLIRLAVQIAKTWYIRYSTKFNNLDDQTKFKGNMWHIK
ncbi:MULTISPECIES: tyrosine-type recombinase/integrase [Gimesia]|jgi:integrase|uniref:Tyrosine-type recombinase/integrase n=2 Tax=Gimesia TaxID=1649453 RepID=A0A6I6AGK0_9PLAN|nr:tyrosine-type recombinase/integrase [Gimesia benthica]QGQ25764.1 tyrosine-type recombinase/integrase [Gimesia benthica]|tara:strand:- start:39 stop:1478 length:1440 start_codon:yes stop_codon:yes gene_type:complete